MNWDVRVRNMKYLVSFFLFLLMIPNIWAITLTIDPAMNSTTTISPSNCPNAASSLPFTITNNGDFGVLCWYYTNENGTRVSLNTSCLGKNQTGQFNTSFTTPTSGAKTTTFYLECFDFRKDIWSWSDGCTNGTSYSQAKTSMFSCGSPDAVGCSGGYGMNIAPRYATMTCTPVSITVTASPSTLNLVSGTSGNSIVKVKNNGSNSITCEYSKDGGSSYSNLGPVPGNGQENSTTVTLTATGAAGASIPNTISVRCTDSVNGLLGTGQATITVVLQADTAKTAIENATNLINEAKTAASNTQNKIQEATNVGADITTAENTLTQAQSYTTTAETKLSNAQSSYNSGDRTTAETQANAAGTDAQTAKTLATNAYNEANTAISNVSKEQQDAANLIDQAKSAIAAADAEVKRAESKAVEFKVDTATQVAELESAKEGLTTANSYYSQASTSLSSKNYSTAKTNAQTAITYATNSESAAKKAAIAFENYSQRTITASTELELANTEIGKANQVYVKLTGVVREIGTYTDVSKTINEIDAQKEKIDSAKDTYSQAQNYASAGNTQQAIDKATEARNTAASAKNKLDRILENMRYTIEDSLDEAVKDTKDKIKKSEEAVERASGTYGASAEVISEAQKVIKESQLNLASAEKSVSSAKSATALDDFLNNASAAFEAITVTNDKAKTAEDKANSAAMGLYTTVAAIGVAGAAGGGGFLYWRSRKKRKASEKPGKKEGIISALSKKHPEEVEWQKKSNSDKEVTKLREEMKNITNKIHELDEKFIDKKITKEQHGKEKARLENKKSEIVEKIHKLQGG